MSKNSAPKWGIIGAISGFIAGLLLAPKSGKETRQDIKNEALKVKGEASKQYDKAKTEVTEKTDEAKAAAKKYSDKTTRAAKKATEAAKEEFSK